MWEEYKEGDVVKVLDPTKRGSYVAKVTGVVKSHVGNRYEYVRLGLKEAMGRAAEHFADLGEKRGVCTAMHISGKASPEEVFEAASDFLSMVSSKITSLDPFHVHMR